MKKFLFIVAVFFFMALLFYKVFFYFDRRAEAAAVRTNSAIARLSATEYDKIQEGDIILRRGFGIFSDFIAGNLNNGGPTDVTHAGIIVKKNGTWQVIHALSSDVTNIDGVQIQPLSTFLQYSAPAKIIITRAKNATPELGKQIAERAQMYLNRHIPFDHSGVIDDDTELFCTELIWRILETDLHIIKLPEAHDEREKLFHSMAPMYATDFFDIIINQYINSTAAAK